MKKGDCVGIYMFMILEVAIVMLVCVRFGVFYIVVFGGFSVDVFKNCFVDVEVKLVVIVDGGWCKDVIVNFKE